MYFSYYSPLLCLMSKCQRWHDLLSRLYGVRPTTELCEWVEPQRSNVLQERDKEVYWLIGLSLLHVKRRPVKSIT